MGPYLAKSNKQIDEVVALVRGSLSKMARITLEALIVIDVHGNVMIVYISYQEKFLVTGRPYCTLKNCMVILFM